MLLLLFPYARESIKLSNQEYLNYQIVYFSASPKSSSCIVFRVKSVGHMVVAVSSNCPGATEWTTVDYQYQRPFFSSKWVKIVFYKDVFCCLSFDGGMGVYNPEKSTWVVHSLPPPRVPENLYVNHSWRCKLTLEHNGDIFAIHTSNENPTIYKLEQTNDVWVETEILGGTTLFAHYLCSHARTDLVGQMRNNIYFPKVRFYGRQCVSYSLDDEQRYDWSKDDPFRSIWIEATDDLSTFLSSNNGENIKSIFIRFFPSHVPCY